jgi:hypothetical protein
MNTHADSPEEAREVQLDFESEATFDVVEGEPVRLTVRDTVDGE